MRLYLVGFIIGLIAVYFIFGNRNLKELTPGMLKMDQLAAQPFHYSDTANCQMKCEHISYDEVKDAMTDAKIDTKKSKSFNQRYPMYDFTGRTGPHHALPNRFLHIICVEIDSVTRIVMVHDSALKADSCKCY